jgi:Arc/MetJ-type ribon-helix-helix transcriptional regulator
LSTPIHARVDDETIRFVDRLVSSGRYRSRTEFVQEAIRELKSQFTGEPTMRTIDGRVKVIEFSVGKLQRNLSKVMEELKIEPVK